MSRPLRIEPAGGRYHVTSRGDRREAIYRDDQDRTDWLGAAGRRVQPVQLALPRLVPNDQPLPHRRGDTRDESLQRDAPTQRRLHAGEQSPPRAGGTPLSGALQGHSGRTGRLPPGTGARCGAQPRARRHGFPGGRLAVEQLSGDGWHGARAGVAGERRGARAVWRRACPSPGPGPAPLPSFARESGSPASGTACAIRSFLAASRLWNNPVVLRPRSACAKCHAPSVGRSPSPWRTSHAATPTGARPWLGPCRPVSTPCRRLPMLSAYTTPPSVERCDDRKVPRGRGLPTGPNRVCLISRPHPADPIPLDPIPLLNQFV